MTLKEACNFYGIFGLVPVLITQDPTAKIMLVGLQTLALILSFIIKEK